MTRLSEAFDALMRQHRRLGCPLPDLLRAGVAADQVREVESRLDVRLHRDVVELFRIADGVDERLWSQRYTVPAYIVPTLEFPGFARCAEDAEMLRRNAAAVEEPGQPSLWDPSWFPVFEVWADEVVAVDCADGTVWLVWWEGVQIHQVAPTLADYLALCLRHLVEHDASFDPQTGELGLAGRDVPEAPLAPMSRAEIRLG